MSARRLLTCIVAPLLIAACSTGGGDGSTTTTDTTEPPAVTTTTAPTTTEAPTTLAPSTTVPVTTAPPTSTTGGDSSFAEAAAAFEQWVGYLAAGDHEAAWDAMAPTSQAAVGRDEFFNGMVHAMAEGWGSWSAATDVSYRLDTDEAGRTLLWVSGTVSPEGMTETREVAIPLVETDSGYLLSPFEEFGNVAEGIEEQLEGAEFPPVPEGSGEGRRVVYANGDQRVWLIEEDGTVVDSYLVSGKKGVPEPGTYEVFSRSEQAFAGHDDITMSYMVRFAHGRNLAIGFHAIPNDASGAPLQSEDQLGEYRSAGCVRQSLAKAAALYEWAVEGTTVVVLP